MSVTLCNSPHRVSIASSAADSIRNVSCCLPRILADGYLLPMDREMVSKTKYWKTQNDGNAMYTLIM